MTVDTQAATLEPERLARLLEIGRTLVSELDLETLLRRILEVARELTGARYAALGILDEDREELERFLVSGLDDDRHHMIGELPRGRGVLGVLITDPRPVRLDDVGGHMRSYGFPPGHPPMSSFLGVPVLIRGEAFGNLYLTEKEDGGFTAEDEAAVVVLADWAAIAIDNARTHRTVAGRRDELERAVRGFEATTELARAVGGETRLELVLDLVVKRCRALLDARTAVLCEIEGDRTTVIAAAGDGRERLLGRSVPYPRALLGDVLAAGRTSAPDRLAGMPIASELGARAAVYTPLRFRGQTLGALVLYADEPFGDDEERLLAGFAASAASAVATAQNASSQALRLSIAAAERERAHWARELHDQTLQELGALRMLLSSARRGDAGRLATAVDDAVELIGDAIAELRLLITELRPAALDQLGVRAALDALADRTRRLTGLEVDLHADFGDDPDGSDARRYESETESALYRIVQEALTNVVRHARATRVEIRVVEDGELVRVAVRDDGVGFGTDGTPRGFGLVGMHERAALLGGRLRVESAPAAGTRVSAELPAARRRPGDDPG